MKPKPVAKPAHPFLKVRSWAEVVVTARSRFETQGWRMSALGSLHGWREFVVGWAGCAFLREYGAPHIAPDELTTDDDLLAWAWDVVSPRVSESIEVAVSRTRLDELTALHCFEVMQGAGLIYPDGEVARRVTDKMAREIAIREAQESLAIAHVQQEVAAIQAKAAKTKGGTP